MPLEIKVTIIHQNERPMKKIFLPIFLLLLFGCNTQRSFTKQKAHSKKGMIAAAHPLAVKAGAEILAQGGNAADAAVAAAFSLAVVEPSMSGLGGRQQIIMRLSNGEIHGIDATSQSPLAYDTSIVKPQRYGYTTIGIPGVVAGLCKLLEERGSLPLASVMAPAIRYAEEGFALLPGEAKRHAQVAKQLGEFEGSRNYFLQTDGKAYPPNGWLVQKDLGKTLRAIARGGKDAFYKGEIAQQIVADMKANGGLVGMEDLANYEAKTAQIVNGSYRGFDLHGLWLPSFGAITMEILHILENFNISELEEAERLTLIYQVIKRAYEDRAKQFEGIAMADQLTSKDYAKSIADQITIRQTDDLGIRESEEVPESWLVNIGHTTHLSVADKDGMVVALTQSLGPIMGSKVASPGLGFMYAISLGEYLRIYTPNQRVSSHISPFLLTKEGEPYLGLGAAGGARIIPAIVQVIHQLIDQNLKLDQALAAPRVYPYRDTLQLESHEGIEWNKKSIDRIEGFGFPIKMITQKGRFARVHAIQYDAKKKKWIGAADPDWEGSASAPRK